MRSYFILIIFLVCHGCTPDIKEKDLSGTWKLIDIVEIKRTSGDNFLREAQLNEVVQQGEILCFYNDGNYSQIKGNGVYGTGKWNLSKDKSALYFIDSISTINPLKITVAKNKNGKEELSLSNTQTNVTLTYINVLDSVSNILDDPYHPANNYWRLKASSAESREQLIARLAGYVKHVSLILKTALDREQDIVSFEYSLGPVKIYNKAIGIESYDDVSESWKSSFYNEEQAAETYALYGDHLLKNEYKGSTRGNWMEVDLRVLNHIYEGIKKL